jgi:cytoplasmic tRNA 2-thiolation protein 1
MVKNCTYCHVNKASIKRPKTGALICKECFYIQFEEEIHQTITEAKLFLPGQKVAIAASGGKGMYPNTMNYICIK